MSEKNPFVKMNKMLLLVVLVLLSGTLTARAQLSLSLTPSTRAGEQGTAVTFSGTLRNTGSDEVFLNGTNYNLDAAGLSLDDSPFFANAPLSLLGGQEWSGSLFDIAINGASAGTHSGSFGILGGLDTTTQDLLATAGFQVVVHPPVEAQNLIVNGGFEQPLAPSGGFFTIPASSPLLVGWTVVAGSVDTVNSGFFPAFEGSQSLDLDGSSAGTIEQSFSTAIGTVYALTFAYANNPVSGATFPASANVSIFGSTSLLSQSITHSSSMQANMNYTPFSTSFTANSTTTSLRFTSTNQSNSVGGIALDAVSVSAIPQQVIPEPGTCMLVAMGLLPLVGIVARRRGA